MALQSGLFDVFITKAEVTSLGGLSQTAPPRGQRKTAQAKEPLDGFTRQYRCFECHGRAGDRSASLHDKGCLMLPTCAHSMQITDVMTGRDMLSD